ncbi:hypothetical protein G5714_004646 [Onychostoma macrolepis]|uniref:Uncharacterized protein n=1 Tax=Onychostoma macrolepis TaxID=369639 RepID=A0A7J6D580_9TELE|nr:hypothetical protein G5714_004646 [Onychostoma macrolepis]
MLNIGISGVMTDITDEDVEFDMGPTPFQRHFEHIIAEAPVHDEGEPNEYHCATFMPSLNYTNDNKTQGIMEKSQWDLKRVRFQRRRLTRLDDFVHIYQISHNALLKEFSDSTRKKKLADLRKLYDRRLEQLGSDWSGTYVHQKRFKEHLLEKLGPEWSALSEGRDVYISHKKIVGAAVAQTSCLQVTEDEAKTIVEVGLMLRKYILLQQMPFNGSFTSTCLSEPVAKPLQTLLDVLIQGSSSVEQNEENQATISARVRVACTISQLICSNAAKQSSRALTLYQRKERETPFPLYVGLKLHGNDRNKGIIKKFHALGISVSYERVMDVRGPCPCHVKAVCS